MRLAPSADHLLIDALRIDCELPQNAIIHGDALSASIAAASILAKVHRDGCLALCDEVFPQYNLASNKGYSTPDHKRALRKHGPTMLHRFSFLPVRANSAHVHWTGYLGDPVQGELFESEEEAILAHITQVDSA